MILLPPKISSAGCSPVRKYRHSRLNTWWCTGHVIFHIKPASWFRFHDNISRLSASKCLLLLHIAHNIVGYVEISVLQQFLMHTDKREPIMSFAAHELPTFTLKGLTCKTYSISIIPGREPWKIRPWPGRWKTLE